MPHRFPSTLLHAALIALAVLAPACMPKEKAYSPTEAEQTLIEFCKKEGSIDIVVQQVGRTEWIYLPLNEPIFDIKADATGANAARKVAPFSLLSIESEFDERTFSFNYDIVPNVLSSEPTTYGSTYNETYTKKRQLIYQGIQETFFNLTKDEETLAAAPIFFVVVVSDMQKGIATQSTFYLQDLKAFMTEALPADEYYMRENAKIFGDPKLIGDKTGKNLNRYEVTWSAFLTDQIEDRIQFKFTRSDFPPKSEPDNAVVSIAANTLRFYPFSDYDALYLYNRRDKRELRFDKEQLKAFEEPALWEKNKGKMTVIKFNLPQTAPGSAPTDAPGSDENFPDAEK